jgi:hypothetical protein
MDYAAQTRLKVLGRTEIIEDGAEAKDQIERLRIPEERAPSERAILIRVEAFDWNCQQHITPRFTEQEIAKYVEPMRNRIKVLEAEIASLSRKRSTTRQGRRHPQKVLLPLHPGFNADQARVG